jgi:divalent metal cation (Fe/Co/Zn/Cd) transporter
MKEIIQVVVAFAILFVGFTIALSSDSFEQYNKLITNGLEEILIWGLMTIGIGLFVKAVLKESDKYNTLAKWNQ